VTTLDHVPPSAADRSVAALRCRVQRSTISDSAAGIQAARPLLRARALRALSMAGVERTDLDVRIGSGHACAPGPQGVQVLRVLRGKGETSVFLVRCHALLMQLREIACGTRRRGVRRVAGLSLARHWRALHLLPAADDTRRVPIHGAAACLALV